MRSQGGESNSLVHGGPRAGFLNPCGSSLPNLLICGKSCFYVICEAVFIGENNAECCSIFDGLAGSLGLKRLVMLQNLRAPLGEWTVGLTHHHWMCSVAHDAGLTLVPISVWFVNVQPPGHSVDGVPKQIKATRVQFVVVTLQNLFYRYLLELEPFLVVSCQLRGHET